MADLVKITVTVLIGIICLILSAVALYFDINGDHKTSSMFWNGACVLLWIVYLIFCADFFVRAKRRITKSKEEARDAQH